MKKIMAVLSATLLLWGCSDNNDVVEEELVKEEKIEVVEEKEDTVVEEVEEVEVQDEPEHEQEESIEEIEEEVEESIEAVHEFDEERMNRVALAEAIMIESFEGMGDVYYDSELDILGVAPTDEGFARDIYYIMTGVSNKDAWNSLVDNVSDFSIVVSELVDEDIQVAILNPESTDRVLLLVQNGFVIYDFADDI